MHGKITKLYFAACAVEHAVFKVSKSGGLLPKKLEQSI
jgi:hypothetical protein